MSVSHVNAVLCGLETDPELQQEKLHDLPAQYHPLAHVVQRDS
ncbi:MAG: hypothetical protein AVDCRST_MAG67-2559 [uncultured Solirubrobacteraceae bacterium]|uniref:Uncharacterized protein n=1 Tax=uncultured Solirubrobacteraceae bacterium TaxID=1162706 RepID=A0A6J4SY39_9ACTN|nr:MAG: hypothetical protein AVDCRST_MAG67-2559 [uncultured Solirubrobacteraceae bacterium]